MVQANAGATPAAPALISDKEPRRQWILTLPKPMFDDVSWFAPFIETNTSEKRRSATTSARHGFERFAR